MSQGMSQDRRSAQRDSFRDGGPIVRMNDRAPDGRKHITRINRAALPDTTPETALVPGSPPLQHPVDEPSRSSPAGRADDLTGDGRRTAHRLRAEDAHQTGSHGGSRGGGDGQREWTAHDRQGCGDRQDGHERAATRRRAWGGVRCDLHRHGRCATMGHRYPPPCVCMAVVSGCVADVLGAWCLGEDPAGFRVALGSLPG